MQQESKTRLTAAEVGILWTQYMDATLAIHMLKHFLAKNEDAEIRQVNDFAQQVIQNKVHRIREIFRNDNYPMPIGITESDVNVEAPRLYSDSFSLSYIRNITRFGLATYGLALTMSSRQDVREHCNQSITEAVQIDERALQVEQSKGLYLRTPCISPPEKPKFVQNSDFFGSLFGSKRPLNAIEIANIFVSSQSNMMNTALLMGFAQTAESKELREFFFRGKQIAHKQAEILNTLLINSEMPAPMSPDSYVTNSTIAPFSDKLMLQHTIIINQATLAYYGTALAFTARVDLFGSYVRLMTEMSQYLEDAEMLMIKYKCMEQPPLAEDRRALIMR